MKPHLFLALLALPLSACAPVANSISKTPSALSGRSTSEMHFSNLDVVALDEDMYVVTEKRALWAKKQIPGDIQLNELTPDQRAELIKGSTEIKLEGDFRLNGIQFFAVLELDVPAEKIETAKMNKVKLKWEKVGPNRVRISLKSKGDESARKYVQNYLSHVSFGYRETTISQ
jgi:hypothetical protein